MAELAAPLAFPLGGEPSTTDERTQVERKDFIRVVLRYRLKTTRQEGEVTVELPNPGGLQSG